jgi:MoaA/NifB/PqqE/SkfB family radical SAM enzyme
MKLQQALHTHTDEMASDVHLNRKTMQLAKLYIEPTNQCNLDCRTCIRNVWDEPLGKMPDVVFERIILGLRDWAPPPTVFFGGWGEPLFHPKIVEMVARTKALGSRVELIINGTRLAPDLTQGLIAAGLDVLWVSLDGATPETYADVRLGATLPQILKNLAYFDQTVYDYDHLSECGFIPRFYKTELGIAFVAMKRNIADLPAVISLGRRFHAMQYRVTNVLPYTPELCDEVLYDKTLSRIPHMNSAGTPRLILPRMDENELTKEPLYRARTKDIQVTWPGEDWNLGVNRCPYVDSGVTAIAWDGSLSPCLPLMHNHTSYVLDRVRSSRRWVIGNVTERSLADLWHAPEYVAFRERVQAWPYAPCTDCGGCDLSDTNERDCLGNSFPTCGGCLWAQGLIQCP